MRRNRRMAALVTAAAVSTTLLFCSVQSASMSVAQAVVGGDLFGDTRPWAALIKFSDGGKNVVCSGALVAEQWVLTASHCARIKETGPILKARAFTIYLDKSSALQPNGFVNSVDRPPVALPLKWNSKTHMYEDDLALLHLATPAPSSLSPLPQAPIGFLAGGSNLSINFTGWGRTESGGPGRSLNTTNIDDWDLSASCSGHRTLCYEPSSSATSYLLDGDSGAPVTTLAKGGYVQLGVYTAYRGPLRSISQPVPSYGTSSNANLSWIRRITKLPNPAANTIVHNQDTGVDSVVDNLSFRHTISNNAVLECFRAKHFRTVAMKRYEVLSIPEDSTSAATCY
jgi:secreted trypsin-like serine protease